MADNGGPVGKAPVVTHHAYQTDIVLAHTLLNNEVEHGSGLGAF